MKLKTPDEALRLCREVVERWIYDEIPEHVREDELARCVAAFEQLDEFITRDRKLPHAWQV